MSATAEMAPQSTTAPTVEVHPRILRPATFPDFPLYARADDCEAPRRVREAGEPVYANTWDKLDRDGIDLLYVHESDQADCLDYVEENLESILGDEELPPEQFAPWVCRLTRRAMQALLTDTRSFGSYERVRTMVEAIVRTIGRSPDAAWHMMDGRTTAHSLHRHSTDVCVLLTGFAARALKVRDRALLTQVAMGAVLHDVGKAAIAPEILAKPAALSRREFAQVKKHPQRGIDLCKPFLGRARIAHSIISQHHEDAGGGGYPDGRVAETIGLFGRAARVVDAYDAMTSDRPYRPALDSFGAVRVMVNEMRGRFDRSLLRRFIRHLGSAPNLRHEAPPPVEAARPPVEAARPKVTQLRSILDALSKTVDAPAAERPVGAAFPHDLPILVSELDKWRSTLADATTETDPVLADMLARLVSLRDHALSVMRSHGVDPKGAAAQPSEGLRRAG